MMLRSLRGRGARLLPLLLASLLVGCMSSSAELRYYLIDPVSLPVIREDAAPLAIAIQDLDMPQYLDRFQIARRVAGNRVDYALDDQWGEPLRKNLMRTLAANLTRALGTDVVATPLSRLAGTPDVLVHLRIERFEADEDGRVQLVARWEVLDGADGAPLGTRRVELASAARVSPADYPALVRAMQTLFGDLSLRIARSLLAPTGSDPDAAG